MKIQVRYMQRKKVAIATSWLKMSTTKPFTFGKRWKPKAISYKIFALEI